MNNDGKISGHYFACREAGYLCDVRYLIVHTASQNSAAWIVASLVFYQRHIRKAVPSTHGYVEASGKIKGWRLTGVLKGHCRLERMGAIGRVREKLDIYNTNVCAQLPFSTFGRDLVSINHGTSGFAGFFYSDERGVQRSLHEPDTRDRHPQRNGAGNKHPERPFGHILLGVKVLAGYGLILGGLGGFCATLHRSASYTPSAGFKRVMLCGLIMLVGGYLIASSIGSERPPRCVGENNDTKQGREAQECF